MPATDYLSTSTAHITSFSRNVFSLRREQSITVDVYLAAGHHELADFQAQVADLLADLAAAGDEEILSFLWVRKLLDTFLLCLEEFRGLLSNQRRTVVGRAFCESLLGDFLARGVKALDFCNASCDGVEQLRQCGRHLDIVLGALGDSGCRSAVSEGRVLRAKKAIAEIAHLMFGEKESRSFLPFQRNRGSASSPGGSGRGRRNRSYFSLVPSTWSASRQLQAIASNIVPPRSQDIVSTSGLAVAVYTMNSVLFFVMWALVAAFPCQDGSLNVYFSVPTTYLWSAPIMSLYDRILEISKKKDRRSSKGLMREVDQMVKILLRLSELTDAADQYPLKDEKEGEIRQKLVELAQVSSVLKDWLDPLESHVREVFRRISRCRTEGFSYLSSYR